MTKIDGDFPVCWIQELWNLLDNTFAWPKNGLEKETQATDDRGTNKIKVSLVIPPKRKYKEATEVTNTEGSKSDILYRWLRWLELYIVREQHKIQEELTTEQPSQTAVGTAARDVLLQ